MTSLFFCFILLACFYIYCIRRNKLFGLALLLLLFVDVAVVVVGTLKPRLGSARGGCIIDSLLLFVGNAEDCVGVVPFGRSL